MLELDLRCRYIDRATVLHLGRRHGPDLVCRTCLTDQAVHDLILLGVVKGKDPTETARS